MNDCTAFLQWALPQLHRRWPGYRKVRGQVCKRLAARMATLGIANLDDYRAHLTRHEAEWGVLDEMCRITISRFYRDRGVFDLLLTELLPELARRAIERGETKLRAWSAGCAGGEEAYSLAIGWRSRGGILPLELVGTDTDPVQLNRARAANYPTGTLRELPPDLRARAFEELKPGLWQLRPEWTGDVEFLKQDVRIERPGGRFDLVLCRNLAFTYFDEAIQRQVAANLAAALVPGGVVAIGKHERLPDQCGFSELDRHNRLYCLTAS